MCVDSDKIDYTGGDEYLGHALVAQGFAMYISLTPGLHYHPFRYPVPKPPPAEPLDIYIARAIHLCQVPNIVPYAASYLLISISQPCQCRTPHDGDQSQCTLSPPSKLSHILSRAVTRTPFANFRWSDRHVFVGAFFFALAIYKDMLHDDYGKELPCWSKLPLLFGISEGEIMKVAIMLQPYVTSELKAIMKSMMKDENVRYIIEIDCPFVHARRKRLLKAEQPKEKSQKRKLSLKGSIDSVWEWYTKPIRII